MTSVALSSIQFIQMVLMAEDRSRIKAEQANKDKADEGQAKK